ncbi:hypothetical protein [Micromonospora sp. NPDC005979]
MTERSAGHDRLDFPEAGVSHLFGQPDFRDVEWINPVAVGLGAI